MAPTSKAFVTVLFLSLALCQSAAAASLKDTIVVAIKDITTQSDNLRVSTQGITLINAVYKGNTIPQGLAAIVSSIAAATNEISAATNANPPLSDDDAKLVVETLTTFVKVQQQLLNVVIGKHGLITLATYFEPIRQSLVALESAVDSFALAVINAIPTQVTAAQAQFNSLATTIDSAIEVYSSPV